MNADDASPQNRCSSCGGILAREGWCARCVLGELAAEIAADADPAAGLFTVPGHVVLAELGRGSAGIVYRARQDRPARDVALKILRPHEAGSAESRARFRMEATTVAGLDHPAILPVLSVGEHDRLPYFTMKLCAGGSLAEHIARYRGAWRETATLLATLADAVQHAHLRGVLHRDLKPGNILFDEEERPFVSDFGIAKTMREANSTAPLTQPLSVMGTRGYLAPEVLREGAGTATLAADVYGLGAILYELLTGAPPAENANGPDVATLRGVPHDLAMIATKCLQPEPAMRYVSAAALAQDLRAWLAGRPIAARPVPALGQAWAWARRNPALAGVSSAALLALVAVATVSSVAVVRLGREQRATTAALARAETERQRAETERQRATTEAAASKAIADFLQNDLLAQASPEQQPDRNLTLRAVLDRAAKKIENRFPAQPLVEAAIRETLARTYDALAEYGIEQEQSERVLEIYRRQLRADDPKTLNALTLVGTVLFRQGKFEEAKAAATQALAAQQRVLGPEHPDVLETMTLMASVAQQRGQLPEAIEITQRMLEISRRTLGAEHSTTLTAMNNLAFYYAAVGKLAGAETLFLQTLEILQRTLGPEHPDTIISRFNLGILYRDQGKLEQAEAVFVDTLEKSKRVLGPEHRSTISLKSFLALTYDDDGRFEEAEALMSETLAQRQRVLGPEHADTLKSLSNLAVIDRDEGKFSDAEALGSRAWEIRQRMLGREHPETLVSLANLAMTRFAEGKFAEAEKLTRETLEIRERVLGSTHADTLLSMDDLAAIDESQSKLREARELRAKSLASRKKNLGTENPITLGSMEHLGGVLLQLGEFQEAEPLFRESLAVRMKLAPNDWRTHSVRSQLGEALTGLKLYPEAERLLIDGYQGLVPLQRRIPAPESRAIVPNAEARLIQLYTAWGKTDEAQKWQRKFGDVEKSR